MPVLKHRTIFEIARRLKAFLRLEVGLTRGEVPDTEQQVGAQTQQLRQAHDQMRRQIEQLKDLRERLSTRNAQVARLQQTRDQQSAGLQAKNQQIIRKDEQIARLQAKLEVVGSGALATARKMPLVEEQQRKLAILDDAFPHLLSAFRIAEYNAYLEEWEDAVVFSTASSFPLLRETRTFKEVLDEYASRYPQFKGRIRSFDGKSDLEDSLVYAMFLNNTSFFLDAIHAYNVPFVFTLYPGGGLQLEQDESDEKLRGVCSSPNLQKVIATQKIVHEYLLDKKLCDPEKIEFIYGGVYPSSLLARQAAKNRYGEDKETFDVCFVAYKYMERGTDKGYDVFVEVARLLAEAYEDISFHVVGPFDETDVDVGGLEGRISFYGTRPTEFFPSFYSRMDAIVSPNAPFLLAPGAFDIFPLGTCIEAGSCGVAVFCTDPLEQNVALKDGEEIVIVPRDAGVISERVGWYHEHPEALRELSERGREAFLRVFDIEAQMKPRLRILSELMGREPSSSKVNPSADRHNAGRMGAPS